MPPPVELWKSPQDGISWVQKVAAVEIGFRGAPRCFGGIWVYIGGRSTSVEHRGAHEGAGRPLGVGAPPTSWPPGSFSYVWSKSPGSCLFQKSRSRRFHFTWIPFDIPFLRNTKIGKKHQFALGLRLIG